jgi:general secretion pathway protein G
MKKAFTMIEVIFVIIIIGIIAAVAIPKLSATRDDAKISSMISNARISVSDIGNYIAAKGINNINIDKVKSATNIDFTGVGCIELDENITNLIPSVLTLCDDSVTSPNVCILIEVANNGNVKVSSSQTSSLCQTVVNVPAIISLAGVPNSIEGKTYHFAGKRILR